MHAIVGCWYVDKSGQDIPPLKKSKLIKKGQKEQDKTKKRLTEANQKWYDWKFQMHWNKLERVNPRSRDERKNPFCMSSERICFKYNDKPAH